MNIEPLTAISNRYPGQINFSCISLQKAENSLHEKKRLARLEGLLSSPGQLCLNTMTRQKPGRLSLRERYLGELKHARTLGLGSGN